VSEGSPISIRLIKPTPERPALTAITVGMSERPMVSEDEELSCELVVVLPPSWDFDEVAQTWPLLALELLAHFPHDHDAFIGLGHTIQNPFPWTQSGLCGAMVADQVLSPSEAAETLTFGERDIHFLGVWFLYEDEMKLKLEEGTERLWELLVESKVTEAVHPDRPSVVPARPKRSLFRRRGK
jgi:hypothetical protein